MLWTLRMNDIDILCQDCGASGARVYQGWSLLCVKCANERDED